MGIPVKEAIEKLRAKGISYEDACNKIEGAIRRDGKKAILDIQLSIVDDVYCEPPYEWEEPKRRILIGKHSKREWEKKKQQYDNRCAYCGRKIKKLTKDHIIPVSLGGVNTIDNIVPCCRKCNSKKRIKSVAEFKAGVMLKSI